ncbi:MAG TPA: GatB/YqeY domain-containing protein [Candidatus Saccharimonadales bacterium]|nr:GatB/YqeY domain-containing protein [Candidatus Saccharimonadales bacterium]
MTKQDLQNELKQSMLAKTAEKTSVLRMLLSAINYYEIQKGGAGYSATDEDVLTVIQREVKQHRDSIEQFQNANRTDLVDKESKELAMLQKYLPEQMSEDEIRRLVKDAISQTGAKTPQEMGKVMGALMPKTKGKADGSLVSKIVKEELIRT